MGFYFPVVAFSLFYFFCFVFIEGGKAKLHKSLLIFALTVLTFLIGFRNGWPDQLVYEIAFLRVPDVFNFDFYEQPFGYVEKGYSFLASIVKTIYDNSTFYFLTMGGLSMWLLYKSLTKYCYIPLIGLCDYIARFLLNRDFIQMRSSLAILLIIFAISMILSVGNIIVWYIENNSNQKILKKEESHLINSKDEKHLDSSIKNDNSDVVGWLIVEGTQISYPVVQYKDNDFYLSHNFEKEKNSAGWIFMDYQNTLDDQNIVIYGHHRKDGSMFGSIDNILNNTNKKDLSIYFITPRETIQYIIFSIYKISSNDNYNDRIFSNFQHTIKKIAERSEIEFNKNYYDTNQIITLSTCHNNNVDRMVVHGYKKHK